MSVTDAEIIGVTEAQGRGVSRLAADAEAGHATVLRRHSVPVAAVIRYHEVQRLSSLERDLVDVALVLTRAASDSGARTSLDAAIESLGFTRVGLEAMDDQPDRA